MEKSIKNKEKKSFNPLNLFKRTNKQDSEILSALERISRQDYDSDFSSLYSTVNKHKSFFEKIDITPDDLQNVDDYADGAIFDTPASWGISDYKANFIKDNYDKGIEKQLNENENHYLNSFRSTLNYRKKYEDLINNLSNIATNFIATGYKPSQVNDEILSSMNLTKNFPGEEQEPEKGIQDDIIKGSSKTSLTPDEKLLQFYNIARKLLTGHYLKLQQDRISKDLQKSNLLCINNIPKEFAIFDVLIKVDYNNPEIAYKNLDGYISDIQMSEFIKRDREKETLKQGVRTLVNYISFIPDNLRTQGLLSALHKIYDNTELANELSYALIMNDLEINEANALKSINHFSDLRFITEYDPIGADDAFGQICGCDYYIHPNMKNPIEHFSSDLLTVQQWHNIAAEDTRLLEFIPKEIIDNEAFWENYTDFIGKGNYLNHPKNEWKDGRFDEYEVFRKMPKSLMENSQISIDLFKRGVIGIDYIKKPNEELYLLMSPEYYTKIPKIFREKEAFRGKAIEAIEYNWWQILDVPEKFITEEIVSAALSYDMELCKVIPAKFLTEDLLIDKIRDYKQQGFFQTEPDEHPAYVEMERDNHTKVLQYVPDEFKTEKVCLEALKANSLNIKFLPKNLKNKFEKELIDITPTKEKTNSINREDMQMFNTVLAEDKNYMNAIGILQEHDKMLSQNPSPEDISVTRQMFSAIIDKVGYDTAAEHLLFEVETKNLNNLFGLNKQKATDIRPEDIHVPGLDEIEIRKHLVDIVALERASINLTIHNQKELYNTHIQEHDFEVIGEGKPESLYQEEKGELDKKNNLRKEVLETELKNKDEFILKGKKSIDILQELKYLNINIEDIKKDKIMDDLLNKGQTSRLVKAYFSIGESNIEFNARLSVKTDEKGSTHLLIHPKKDLETVLSNGFKGHSFTDEEKGNLMALESAGHIITINNENYLIGIDSLTNELIARKQQDIKIPDEFWGQKLPDKKRDILANGEPIFLEEIKKGDMECSGLVQYSVERGRLEFLQYGLNISAIQNIKLPKEQQELLQKGKTVLVSGLFDSEGVKYNAWVRLDMKNRTLMQTKELPNKEMLSKKEIIPDNEHRTQVNQNTKGIKTEENKFSSTPLLSGRLKPSDSNNEKRNKRHKV